MMDEKHNDSNLIESFKNLSDEEKNNLKNKLILRQLESAEELQAWMYLFFDILFPMGPAHPDSTHGPADAIWRIYELFKTGESQNTPNLAMLASRDSYKTLSAAALEVLCMTHFRMPVAHMAAIKTQSAKAIQYVNSFFRKISPHLEHHGWKKQSDSKTYIEWITDQKEVVYLNVVTATLSGANSEHVPLLCIHSQTKIITNKGTLAAQDAHKLSQEGHNIQFLSFNHIANKLEFKDTTKSWQTQKDETYTISTKNKTMKVSKDHKVFVKNKGYIAAKDVELGDVVITLKRHKDGR